MDHKSKKCIYERWFISSLSLFFKKFSFKIREEINKKRNSYYKWKIISDQTFGFWIALFLGHHYSLIGGQPIHIFAHKPTIEDRASLYSKLDDIGNFRNRVNHFEPLCLNGNNIDCSETLDIRAKLYNLISWIEPDLVSFFESIDNVQSKQHNADIKPVANTGNRCTTP